MNQYIIAAVVLLLIFIIWNYSSATVSPSDNIPDDPDAPIPPVKPNPNNSVCVGDVVNGILSVREQPHGQCGSDMECAPKECAGQAVPRCADSHGSPICPTCVDGKYTCTYFAGDISLYPMQPTGSVRESFPSFADEFAECTNRGDNCKWGAMNGKGLMYATGRGNANPSKTTGYRILGSAKDLFHRDVGFDNSASFNNASVFANNMDMNQYRVNNIEECEDKTVAPYTYDNVKYDGGYAYVYDVGGQCSVFRIGPGGGTSGTGKYIKK